MRAILWDNDGVLVDTEELYYRATRDALAELGVALGVADYVEISLRRGESCFDLAYERGIDAARVEATRLRRNARYEELLRGGVGLIDGVADDAAHAARARAHGDRHQHAARALRAGARAHRHPRRVRAGADRRRLHALQARPRAVPDGGGATGRRARRLSRRRGHRARARVGDARGHALRGDSTRTVDGRRLRRRIPRAVRRRRARADRARALPPG